MWQYTRSMMSVQAMLVGRCGGWQTGISLSFEGPHGMVTSVFFSENQSSLEGNPA